MKESASHSGRGVVYELIDPRDGQCRYVGQSFVLERRRQSHQAKKPVYQQNNALYQWQDELRCIGMLPELRVIEEGISPIDINERERFWCRQRSDMGCDLLNKPVGAISQGDLFGALKRAELSMQADEVVEVMQAMHRQFAAKLPKAHKAHKHLLRSVSEMRQLKWAIES